MHIKFPTESKRNADKPTKKLLQKLQKENTLRELPKGNVGTVGHDTVTAEPTDGMPEGDEKGWTDLMSCNLLCFVKLEQ